MREVITSKLENVAPMAARMRKECLKLGWFDGDGIELAISEALNNSILHAHPGLPRLTIEVSVKRVSAGIQVNVRDRMNNLDASSLNACDVQRAESWADAETGRGLMIISKLVDKVEYQNGSLVMTLYMKP